MGQSSSSDDLADLLYAPDDVASASHGDDLLSQLAGESIDRMMSGEFEPIVNPVEKLTNQLDTFFEELQHRRLMKSIPPASLASPQALAIARQAVTRRHRRGRCLSGGTGSNPSQRICDCSTGWGRRSKLYRPRGAWQRVLLRLPASSQRAVHWPG